MNTNKIKDFCEKNNDLITGGITGLVGGLLINRKNRVAKIVGTLALLAGTAFIAKGVHAKCKDKNNCE